MFERSPRPPVADKPISVVLPASEAEVEIEPVLRDWLAYLKGLNRDFEIILVDDNSSDRTLEIAQTVASDEPRLRVLSNTGPKGFGAALRVGLSAAQYPLFFYADCSSAYQASDLRPLLEAIDQAELVSGYRVNHDSRSRLRGDFFFRRAVRLLFGVRLKDMECSFKLFRREIFARIPVQSDGIFAHTEILAKANFLGCMMAEAPVTYSGPARLRLPQSALRQRRKDASRLFFHPDFGPAILPESTGNPVEPGNTVSLSTEAVLDDSASQVIPSE